MKNCTKYLFFALTISLFVACEPEEPQSLQLSSYALQMEEDSVHCLSVIGATGTILWSSSDALVATVSAKGCVTAMQEGMATITASCGDVTAQCVVYVTAVNLEQYRRMSRSVKRGVSFNFTRPNDVTLLQRGISWSYNWGPDVLPTTQTEFTKYNLDFCPMAWNGGFDENRIRAYVRANPSCKYLLAFNEPNLTDQANMTPAKAAEYWSRLKKLADELGLKIVSPAMNYGTLSGYGDPIVWLDEFFTLIPKEDISAIAIHCYMPNVSALRSYVERFRKYNLPIWMTEFCAWDGFNASSAEPQIRYMSEVVNYMEKEPLVERYAWFIPRGSSGFPYYELLDHNEPSNLTDAGNVYVAMSSLDKTVYHNSERILAQEYCDFSDVAYPHLTPSTDVGGALDVTDFFNTMWLDYQVEFSGNESTAQLRYRGFMDSECQILIDGSVVQTVVLPQTGDVWTTAQVSIQVPAGKHTVRLQMTKGNIHLHWFRFLTQ